MVKVKRLEFYGKPVGWIVDDAGMMHTASRSLWPAGQLANCSTTVPPPAQRLMPTLAPRFESIEVHVMMHE
jgi:hypothetical protein